MNIEEISDLDNYSDKFDFSYTEVVAWNNKEVHLMMDQTENSVSTYARDIIANFQMPSCGKSFKMAPLNGSATVSVEKDPDGNASAEVEITISSPEKTYEISASGKVDQDGNTSGKVEATFNW